MSTTKKRCDWILATLIWAIFINMNAEAGSNIDVVDPGGLSNPVNALGETMFEEVGNYSIAQFNANPDVYNHTFDIADGYGSSGDVLTSTTLTEINSGVDLTTQYFMAGTGYGRIINAFYPTGGGEAYVMSSVGTHSMVFDRDVQGVGFTINRCYITVTIKLFDGLDNQVGSTYTVVDNTHTGSAHSFFGYYDPAATIRRVDWTTPFGNQLSLDDFVVIVEGSGGDPTDFTSPTPSPMQWETPPQSSGAYSIFMTAAHATDDSGVVYYYFEETSGNPGGSDSGWQASRFYIDHDLNPNTSYTYRVKAQDNLPNRNETAFSQPLSATTAPGAGAKLPDISNVTGSDVDETDVLHTLHVSVDGNDLNTGTALLPLRTVNEAATRAAQNQQIDQGTKVIIHPGTYREYVDALLDGYDSPGGVDAPIIFEAEVAGTAILSASEIYTGWTRQGSTDIYTHTWTHDWGLRMEPPWDNLPNYRQQKFLNNPILRRVEMFFANGQHLTQVLTYGHDVEHDRLGLTERENSFYIDEANDLVYIHLPAGSNINDMTIESAERTYIFEASNIRNLVFRGLIFQHAANTLSISTNGGGYGALHLDGCDNLLLEDNLCRWNNGIGYQYPYCLDVTMRRNVSNYNGFGGNEGMSNKNFVIEDNEESYNNWRGEMGNWKWDNSGPSEGLYSGWTGTRFYRMHQAVIRRHKAIGNYARGVWFDYDNEDILYEDALLEGNMDGLKFEVCQGPIWIKDCRIVNNRLSGILVQVARDVTLQGCELTGNGYRQSEEPKVHIRITSATEHYQGSWEGGSQTLYLGKWTMVDNLFGGAEPYPLIAIPNFADFVNTLNSYDNYWYHTSLTNAFELGYVDYNFSGWQSITGQDTSSVFATAPPVPAVCDTWGVTQPQGDVNHDCVVNLIDHANIAGVWNAPACEDPLVSWPEDVNRDCTIDLDDMAIIFQNWLQDTNP